MGRCWYVGDTKPNHRSPVFKEFANCLMGGDEGTGKSLYIKEALNRLKRTCPHDVEVYLVSQDKERARASFIKLVDDVPSLLTEIASLMEDKKKREAHKKTILVIIDGCETLLAKDKETVARLEELMGHSKESNIYFILATRYPRDYTEKMKALSPLKFCFSVDDDKDSYALLDTYVGEELPLMDEGGPCFAYLRENDLPLMWMIIGQ